MEQEQRTFTAVEAAAFLGTSYRKICYFIASGELPTEKSSGTYRITEQALETLRRDHAAADYARYRTEPDDTGFELVNEIYTEPNWTPVADVWDAPPTSGMTFVDLFCGAGGLSRGLEMAGMHGLCGLDFFKEAGMTYARNFTHPFVYGDITLPETKQRFYDTVLDRLDGRQLDIVAGGFPCQGFSMAGHHRVDDSRNSLYKELLEIVETLNPRYVVCENVKGLRMMLGGLVEKKIVNDFTDLGYRMNVAVLNAADYLVPQKRERVIFIGNRIGRKNLHPSPVVKPSGYVTIGQAIGDLVDRDEDTAWNHIFTRHSEETKQRIMAVPEGGSLTPKYKETCKKLPWDKPSCTIKENHGGVLLHPKLPRVMTPRELARLQSFPDDFIFEGPKTKQLTQIGNAVPPLLGKAIGLAVRKSVGDI